MCDEYHQKSINVDLQTQNSTDDPLVLYTCILHWVLVTEGSSHLAVQLEVEKLDHLVSSLKISSAFQQHDVSCENTGCQGISATCSVCTSRTFSEPHSVHEGCGYLTAAHVDHLLVVVTVTTAVNPVLPGTAQDSPAGHIKSQIPLRH